MVNTLSLDKGTLVINRAGRDAGEVMMVLEVLDEQYVLLVDGKRRKLAKPKKKKAMHLQKTKHVLSELVTEESIQDLNDSKIRKAIAERLAIQEES